MDLYNHLSRSHCIVMHVRIEIGETSGREGCHLVRIKGISHSNFERS